MRAREPLAQGRPLCLGRCHWHPAPLLINSSPKVCSHQKEVVTCPGSAGACGQAGGGLCWAVVTRKPPSSGLMKPRESLLYPSATCNELGFIFSQAGVSLSCLPGEAGPRGGGGGGQKAAYPGPDTAEGKWNPVLFTCPLYRKTGL